MNGAIWRSLLWKEWREHRWKLVALVTIAISLHLWAMNAVELDHRNYAWPIIAMLWIVLPISSILVATGIAAGEESQCTASFLKSLPIDIRSAAAAKLIAGVLTVLAAQGVALLLTVGLLRIAENYNWATRRNSNNFLLEAGELYDVGHPLVTYLLLALLVGVSLIFWVAAPAVNSKSEVRAGAIGLIVVVACWTLFAWGSYLLNDGMAPGPFMSVLGAYVTAMLPGGMWPALAMTKGESGQTLLLIPFLLSHVPLAWWYITRFGHTGDRERARLNDATPLVAPAPVWLGPARRSPLTALLWKHARECAPIVLAGAIGAVGLTFTLMCLRYNDPHLDFTNRLSVLTGEATIMAFITLGCCVGLVSGAGVFTSELEPRLYAFWRTRPISIDLWFAGAFLGGLALLVAIFGVPIAIALQYTMPKDLHGPLPPLLPILILSYASGAFTASFIRNAVYASLLGLGVMAIVFGSVISEWAAIPEAWLGVATLTVSALLGVAAWVCVRNDWSLRLS